MKNFFFDYIYYRLNKFYFKWDGENGITSVIGVSMIQCLLVFDVFLIVERLVYSKSQIAAKGDAKIIAYAAVILFIGLAIYNGFKYKHKYSEFCRQWEEESKELKIIKGLLVLLILALPWTIIFLLAEF